MASLTGRAGVAETPPARVERAREAVRAAIAAGITTFHYGPGYKSGFVLKELFRQGLRQDNLQLIAKLPSPTFDEDRFSAATVRKFVEQILSETGFERITVGQYIFQGRCPTEAEKVRKFEGARAAVTECFEKLRTEGKVMSVVGFAYSAEFAGVLVDMPGMLGVAGFFNMMENQLYALLPKLRASGRSLMAMRPLCGGILTQKRPDWSALPEGDRLKTEPMRGPFLQRQELGRLFADVNLPFEAIALRYVLSFPEVATCIVGFDSREQVQNVLDLVKADVPFDGKPESIHAIFRKQSAESRYAAFHSTKGWQE